ncbi:DUF364 domain-containing protein, partial [Myxococcota bacterium]|nr:DUF364 domain-containing protein [Myxococcota bacterium]
MELQDPLKILVQRHGVNTGTIKYVVTGMKYTAVLLQNGNIGVCANLGTTVGPHLTHFKHLDLSHRAHRILAVAYFNAHLNYAEGGTSVGDIFDVVAFEQFSSIVMVGYFAPVVERFTSSGIPLTIFDPMKEESSISPEQEKAAALAAADAVILTSTSIFNNTFADIMGATHARAVHLLGPSSLLDPFLFEYGVTSISGTRFGTHDERVLEMIESNLGTRAFIKLGQK